MPPPAPAFLSPTALPLIPSRSLPRAATTRARHASCCAAPTGTCRVCKQTFRHADNGPDACAFHPGAWTGAENSKLYGCGPRDVQSGCTFFYECCDARVATAPGCARGRHRTYDEG